MIPSHKMLTVTPETRRHSSQFESVDTYALAVGDKVAVRGSLFLLVERFEAPNTTNPEFGGELVVWFTTKCLEHDPQGVPAHWLETWTIQGNRLARWARLLEQAQPLALSA